MLYQPNYKYLPPAHFHILTPLYDLLCTLLGLGKKFRRQILDSISIKETDVVLDIGCGTGVFLLMLKEKYPALNVIGVDPDEKSLKIAERRLSKYSNVKLIKAFAESIPIEDNSVDIVVSTLTFHHLPDEIKEKAIFEIYRVLKQGGKIVITDFGKVDNWLVKRLFFFEKREYLEGNFKGLLQDYIKKVGFRNITVTKENLPLFICNIIAEK